MQITTLILLLAFMTIASFHFGRRRSLATVAGVRRTVSLHSLPGYYGYYVAIWCALPALLLLTAWLFIEPRLVVALVVKSLPDSYATLTPGE